MGCLSIVKDTMILNNIAEQLLGRVRITGVLFSVALLILSVISGVTSSATE